jgi:predicted transcriptional regulator
MRIQSLSPEPMNHRRDPILIVSEMLSCAIRGVGKTEMMYKVGLSSAQANKYLALLLRSDLLAVRDNDEKLTYETTTKGKSFLDTFETFTKLLN